MSRKKSSEESIITSTLDLIDKCGKESFSVRNVANHMNISTQPIYSNFENSNQLYSATLAKIEKQLLKKISYPYSEFPFRNMGYGFVLYAKECPNLFDAFFSDIDMNKRFIKIFLKKLRDILDTDQRFYKMSDEGKDSLLTTMWTFSYGYASLIIKGLVDDSSDDSIMKMILDTGTAVIMHRLRIEKIIP